MLREGLGHMLIPVVPGVGARVFEIRMSQPDRIEMVVRLAIVWEQFVVDAAVKGDDWLRPDSSDAVSMRDNVGIGRIGEKRWINDATNVERARVRPNRGELRCILQAET